MSHPFPALLFILTGFLLPHSGFSQRTPLKPGFNLFSPQQDVELGRQVAEDAEKKLPMLDNSRVDGYLRQLGEKLAARAPGEKYPYQFKAVNDDSINAFALPGGFLFVNRGTIEAADNEAELAGVIGHEIGHVALRHGTNQATKAYAAKFPLVLLGGILGKNSFLSAIAQIGTGFTLNSILLKYSRDDERQADLMGAQILYDAGYDPRYMASFFEKLDTKGQGLEFFSSHPNPENRIQSIDAEIGRLGQRSGGKSDSREFQAIRKYVKSLPPAPKASPDQQSQGQDSKQPRGRPVSPSSRFRSYDAGNLSVQHPDNWNVYGENHAFTLAPDGGLVQTRDGEALAYGAIMSVYGVEASNRRRGNLKNVTDRLIDELQKSNSAMRISRDQGQIRIGGQPAISKIFINDSPVGGSEVDWLVTVLRPEGLVYFIFVVPENEFGDYQLPFQQILNSVTFK
jgi:hypothetical protein